MEPTPTTVRDAEPMTPTETDVEARTVVLTGVWVSAARCIVQYVLAPGLGMAGFWLPWLSQLVQVLACLVTVSGALRLQAQQDPRRRLYAAIAVAVLASTVWSLLRPFFA